MARQRNLFFFEEDDWHKDAIVKAAFLWWNPAALPARRFSTSIILAAFLYNSHLEAQ
jgi:hypothetical protein